ncbi:hypothetical protein AAG747_22950 [Rapidithrix thailandica]|uniref:Uncharacterized protein n=1 Tax=Rapidithrix thailandica TaxID=413964 RepID=A0AAW9SE92_9BACT
MKKLFYLCLLLSTPWLSSCEEKDVLEDLGAPNGHIYPNVYFTPINSSYTVGKSVDFELQYWSVGDAIEKVDLYTWSAWDVTTKVTVAGEEEPQSATYEEQEEQEEQMLFESAPHQDTDYVTVINAYRKNYTFQVEEGYFRAARTDVEWAELSEEARAYFSESLGAEAIENNLISIEQEYVSRLSLTVEVVNKDRQSKSYTRSFEVLGN